MSKIKKKDVRIKKIKKGGEKISKIRNRKYVEDKEKKNDIEDMKRKRWEKRCQ